MKKKSIHLLSLVFVSSISTNLHAEEKPTSPAIQEQKNIKTFAIFYGHMDDAKISILANYDIVDLNRFNYNQPASSIWTWTKFRNLNPDIQIYLYQEGPFTQPETNEYDVVYLNNIGRYSRYGKVKNDLANYSTGHSMGDIVNDNPHFILTFAGTTIEMKRNNKHPLLDFGSDQYAEYWKVATVTDIIAQTWKADGIFVDGVSLSTDERVPHNFSSYPSAYPSASAWNIGITNFINYLASRFNALGQKLIFNLGHISHPKGSQAWQAIDQSPNPPYLAFDEGFVAVYFGSADVQFYNHDQWKQSIDTVGLLNNMQAALHSHTDLGEGVDGTSNWGGPVNSWDVFYYSLCSYLLARKQENNAYFFFRATNGDDSYGYTQWYDEYDKFNQLGEPVEDYHPVANISPTIYARQFEHGYIYVNPNHYVQSNPGENTAKSIILPESAKRISHEEVNRNWNELPDVASFNLEANRGAVFYTENPTIGSH